VTILTAVDRLPLVTTDLDELLREVARGDVEAFATFYDRTRARVFGLVTRVLRDPGYSEETTQDIYLQV
jgi:RNA polymerase sigma-70 factor, ECF subfamily